MSLFTEDHKLSTSSTGARSHSGWDYTGRCTCGEWSRKYGDHSGFDPVNRLREEHAEHVREVTSA